MRRAPALIVAVIAFAALVDYARRSAHEITSDDAAELQIDVMAGGIPHGTSYPLYVWLLRLFILLPVDSVAFRCNLFSAICAAFAVAAIAWVASTLSARGGRERLLGGAAAAAVLALSHTVTSTAIFTGMYTLHLFMALVVIALVAAWARTSQGILIELAMGLLGAMLGNHIMTLALLPAVGLLAIWMISTDRQNAKSVLRGFGWGCVGLLSCNLSLFYFLWRDRVPFDHWSAILSAPKFFDIDPGKAGSFWYAWWYETTCRQFRFDITNAPLAQRLAQMRLVVPGVAAELSPFWVGLAAIGIFRVFRENRRIVFFLFVIVATHVWLASGYTANTKTHIYLLPVTAVFSALGGIGFWSTATRMRRLATAKARGLGAPVLVVAAALSMGAHQWSRELFRSRVAADQDALYRNTVLPRLAPRPDQHDERTMLTFATKVAAALPPRALVFADWSQMYAIYYVLRFERGMSDVQIWDPYPYGVGRREFPIDYLEKLESPKRSVPVFFISPSKPPSIPGFRLEGRTAQVSELVRMAAP